MKVIDLYKLIANKEYDKLPKKIMIKDYDYIFSLREDCTGYKWYGEVNTHDDFKETINQNLEFILNCEITILDKIEEEKKIPEEININLAYIDKEYLLDKEDVDRKINEIINRHNILVDKLSDYLKCKGE